MDKPNRIISFIPVGEANAIHQAELCQLLQISTFCLKAQIKAARRAGVPICSGSSGYWIAESTEENRAFVEKMRAHALSQLITADQLSKKADRCHEQLVMELCEHAEE